MGEFRGRQQLAQRPQGCRLSFDKSVGTRASGTTLGAEEPAGGETTEPPPLELTV